MRIRCSARLAAAAVLALCFVMLSCRSAEQKFTGHLERGEQYEQGGKHEEALLEYRNALQLQPSSAEANFRIARALSDKGSYGDALFFYREAQRLDPTRSEAALAEAKLLLFQDTPRADEIVRAALEREPDNALAHLRAAEVALAKDDTKTALASVLTAIELDPKEGLYPYNLGVVRLASIRETRAKQEQPPDSLFQAALDAFRKSDQLYGGNLNARLMLARTYASWPGHEKETEAALRDGIAFAKEKGSPENRHAAAQALLDYAGISQKADLRAWGLEEMVDADPSALAAWAELAANADAQGKSGEEVYQRLLAVRPSDIDAYVRYASFLASKNRGDDAIQALDGAVAKGGDPAAALDAKTRLLLQLKRPDEARATVDRLREEFASSPRASLAAARLSLYEQRPADAITELNRVTSSIEDAEAQFLLSQAQATLGNLEPAMAAIDRALALSPQLPLPILQQKVMLHAAARDWPTVLQTLQTIDDGQAADTWQTSSHDLRAYKGRTVQIHFEATTDDSSPTGFYVDDVSLNVCTGAVPTPTSPPGPTATPTIGPAASGCREIVENGGFETGDFEGWDVDDMWTSSSNQAEVTDEEAHSGDYSAWLGGYEDADDVLVQSLVIPAQASRALLSYFWQMDTEEEEHGYDFLYVRLLNTDGDELATLQTADDGAPANQWRSAVFDLKRYAGQEVQLQFEVTGDENNLTSFFVDDVRLETCGGPTPTPRSRIFLPVVVKGARR